jgi:hypothetical protein
MANAKSFKETLDKGTREISDGNANTFKGDLICYGGQRSCTHVSCVKMSAVYCPLIHLNGIPVMLEQPGGGGGANESPGQLYNSRDNSWEVTPKKTGGGDWSNHRSNLIRAKTNKLFNNTTSQLVALITLAILGAILVWIFVIQPGLQPALPSVDGVTKLHSTGATKGSEFRAKQVRTIFF